MWMNEWMHAWMVDWTSTEHWALFCVSACVLVCVWVRERECVHVTFAFLHFCNSYYDGKSFSFHALQFLDWNLRIIFTDGKTNRQQTDSQTDMIAAQHTMCEWKWIAHGLAYSNITTELWMTNEKLVLDLWLVNRLLFGTEYGNDISIERK